MDCLCYGGLTVTGPIIVPVSAFPCCHLLRNRRRQKYPNSYDGRCRRGLFLVLSQIWPPDPPGVRLPENGFGGEHAMIEFKGSHFERDVILWAVRWYVAYPISYRQLEEMMEEHGVEVDHATLNRWVLKYVPLLDQAFRARKRPVGPSWRMDETYVRVKGAWKYLYRAVDKAGATVDFLLTAKRDRKAALRFLRKAIKWNGTPAKITIDKSGANTAAIESHNAETEASIEIRQIKYLNNIVEQDHRAIKRLVRPMLGFKSFRSAAVTLAGVELMHMIRKGQLRTTGEVCPARQFYSLAG
jgi:putative transposase